MKPGDDEARLRAAMAEAHRRDAGQTPRFETMWTAARRARSGRPAWRWAVLSTAVAAAAVGLWVIARPGPPPAPWPVISTRWVGPTDFLLETPDLVTLRSLPPIDPAEDPWTARPPAPRGLP